MFISDVKGELFLYTAEKLKKLGYDVIAIDYINFLKSNLHFSGVIKFIYIKIFLIPFFIVSCPQAL